MENVYSNVLVLVLASWTSIQAVSASWTSHTICIALTNITYNLYRPHEHPYKLCWPHEHHIQSVLASWTSHTICVGLMDIHTSCVGPMNIHKSVLAPLTSHTICVGLMIITYNLCWHHKQPYKLCQPHEHHIQSVLASWTSIQAVFAPWTSHTVCVGLMNLTYHLCLHKELPKHLCLPHEHS